MVDAESLVPEGQLLWQVDGVVDLEKLYEIVKPLYSAEEGQRSIALVVLFKTVANANLNKRIKQEVPAAAKRYREYYDCGICPEPGSAL